MTLNVFGTGNYGATMFSNQFIDKFRFGGFIDQEMKDDALSRAKRLNYFGGEASYGISFSDPVHKLFGNWGYYTEISSNISSGVQFTDDIYELTFYGNKNLAGDSSFLAQTGFHSRKFNKFSFGLNDNKLKIGLSFLSFSEYNQGLVQNGYVYTDSTANNIYMDIDANQLQSNNNYKYAGTGIAIDFEYKLFQQLFSADSSSSKETTIIVGVKNIGVYFSRKNAITTDIDTTYHYEGFEVNSFTGFGNSIVDQQQLNDSISIQKDTTNFVGMLPFEIYFFKPATYGKKREFIYGFRYKIQSNYRAFLYAGANFNLKKGLNISPYLSYGGYSKLQLGLSLNKRFKNLLFEINSSNLLGLVSKNQFGKAAGASIKYNFR